MQEYNTEQRSPIKLDTHGLSNLKAVHRNLATAALYKEVFKRNEGIVPQATFSACFGAPFMAQLPSVYAELLGKKFAEHNSSVWLVNTGWTGGPYGVGRRMKIAYTRAMVNAALNSELDNVEYVVDPIFGVQVPISCPHVPSEVLTPKNTWSDGDAYNTQARKLAGMFTENFKNLRRTSQKRSKRPAPWSVSPFEKRANSDHRLMKTSTYEQRLR